MRSAIGRQLAHLLGPNAPLQIPPQPGVFWRVEVHNGVRIGRHVVFCNQPRRTGVAEVAAEAPVPQYQVNFLISHRQMRQVTARQPDLPERAFLLAPCVQA